MNCDLLNYGANERVFAEASLYQKLRLARVISQYKDLYKIITAQGETLAEVSGRFRYEAACLSDYPAVGDFIMTDYNGGNSSNAIIHHVLTRKSVFARCAVGMASETQIVASNIDLLFICMSLNNDYNLSRLERYLSIAWNSGATPAIVLTKADLCDDLTSVLNEVSSAAPSTSVIATSSIDQISHDALQAYLKPGLTAAFIGSSGVGKSTLINCLAKETLLDTSAIRKDDKGKHTTTRRELFVLPQGGIVIDTPGMRELGVESVDLAKSFSDIDELRSQCRFNDCTHTNEPGCAIKRALAAGELNERRLENYEKLKREAKYDGLSAKQIETEKLNMMFAEIGGLKNMRKFIKQNNKRR